MAGKPQVGVLAYQGDVREHAQMLASLGADVALVRHPAELARVDGLVIPGGESSVIDKLTRMFGMLHPLRERIAAGMPAYGTCAGLIMLADRIEGAAPGQQSIGGLDVTVQRNAFGPQAESFETLIDAPALGGPPVHATFIRAPIVAALGPRATALLTLDDGRIVGVEQGALMGTSFHPEVSGEPRLHERFLARVRARA